ncbi:hypothetical protein [Neptunicoccus cionae]|uniref:Uncharacterized protein n=1 Tax=Neptunicoccus cionae TaxID=2035344 RepID=A0A916QYU6_9RHOB|nr:hypothetical protein [Amylibacter cionae]GGA22501.1 hypothetical protein GCM10011498_24110 [Amylibacter cionae]
MSDQQQTEPAAPDAASDGVHHSPHSGREDTSGTPALGRVFTALSAPKAAKTLFYALVVLCVGLFLADFFYKKYTYVAVENIPGFYALYGFIITAGLVLLAKIWGNWVRRPEDYYAPNDVDAEAFPQDELDEEHQNG